MCGVLLRPFAAVQREVRVCGGCGAAAALAVGKAAKFHEAKSVKKKGDKVLTG